MIVWTSVDGITWTRSRVSDTPAWVSGISFIGEQLVAAGYDRDGAAVWISEDDGVTWDQGRSLAGEARNIYPTHLITVDDIWLAGALDIHGPPTTGNAMASAVVFASGDQGSTWQEVHSQSHSDEGVFLEGVDYRPAGVRDVRWFGGRVIAVGSTGNGSAPIWIGTWE